MVATPSDQGHTQTGGQKYRAEIDGLRAVAVLSVVGYHAFPDWIGGGFIGVDIFFVISGFLITSILLSSLESNRFSILNFYSRRIKRIFPALLVVLIACFALGWVTLLAGEYAQLGKHIASGAGFVSNFVLWSESGYFDNAAETKPLLHLWSLAIEEQFYIFWPLLLAFAWSRRWNIATIMAAIAATSFAFSVYTITANPTDAFYFPALRFWELMIGCLLAYVSLHKPQWTGRFKSTQSLLGLLLFALGLVFIDKARSFPGWWALLPTLGAFFIISAGKEAFLNSRVLSAKPLVWFGLISYPLYLWHWPLLSFARIIEGARPRSEMRIAIVLLSILLAWLTYRMIEKPVRFGRYAPAKTVALVILMIAVGYSGWNSYSRNGLLWRNVVQINATKESGWDGGWDGIITPCEFLDERKKVLFSCFQDRRSAPRYALVGDSKAGALAPGLFRTSLNNGRWVYFGSNESGALVPILSDNDIYRNYQRSSVEVALDLIEADQQIKYAVLATATRALFQLNNDYEMDDLPTNKNYSIALQGLDSAIAKLLQAGKKIVLMVDNPTLPHPEDCMERITSSGMINKIFALGQRNPRCYLDIGRHLELSKQYRRLLSAIKEKHSDDVEIFDPTNLLCDEKAGVCPPLKNGRVLYGVTDHVSDYAAGIIGVELNKFLARQHSFADP